MTFLSCLIKSNVIPKLLLLLLLVLLNGHKKRHRFTVTLLQNGLINQLKVTGVHEKEVMEEHLEEGGVGSASRYSQNGIFVVHCPGGIIL